MYEENINDEEMVFLKSLYKDFNIDDLLNREEVKPNLKLLNQNIHL